VDTKLFVSNPDPTLELISDLRHALKTDCTLLVLRYTRQLYKAGDIYVMLPYVPAVV
jgi:hypothetical protein